MAANEPLNPQNPAAALQEPAGGDSPEDRQLRRASSHIARMHNFRRQYDARRAYHYRQYLGQRDQRYFPDNLTRRANTFVPYPLSNVETITSRVLEAFFSFDPWFEAKPRGAQDEAKVEPMQLVLGDRLEKAQLKPVFEKFVRNALTYDIAALKVDWDWESDLAVDPQPEFLTQTVTDPMSGHAVQMPVADPATGAPIVTRINPVWRPVPRARPKLIVIDPYDLLVDPDGKMIAHCTEKTLGELLREQEGSGNQLYRPEGLAEIQQRLSNNKAPDDVLIRIAELWDEREGTVTILTFRDSEAIYWKDLRASYRNANLSSFKRQVYGGVPILLYHGPNPFGHKRAPILTSSYIKLTGESYGMGAIEIIADLTEGLNTFVNMITDNWNLGINRRYAYNVDADIDQVALNSFNVPGGRVAVSGNPNDVISPLPFFTPQRGDYAILDVFKGMIEMTGGVSDFYGKGIGSPTGNKTATGIASIINESNFRFKMFIRNLEIDVLQPLLAMCAANIQQYMTDDIEVRLTDQPAAIDKWPRVSPEQLIGNFDFELVAANYATNKVIRQRNLLAFANWASQTAYWNPYEGTREMGKVFEIRNVAKMLYTPDQVAQMQQAALAQQVQLMILEKMLDTESQARLSQAKPQTSKDPKTGRPRTTQFEGKIPGAGLSSSIREFASGLTGGDLGLKGLGEVPGGGE